MALRHCWKTLLCVATMIATSGVVLAQDPSSGSGQATSTGSGQATSTGSGQAYPRKPIRIVTSAVGGGTDFVARLIAQELTAPLGQPLIVDNRPAVALGDILPKAPADGYTLMVGGESLWVGALLRKVSYDPLRDFAPVTLAVRSHNVLTVHASVPVKTVRELIDLAKAKPGALNYGSASIGSATHMAAELFKSLAGVNIVHIPYKGSGDLIISLTGGQVQLAFASITSVAPHIKSGKLRALAVTSIKPSALVPDLPTVAATVPGYGSGGETVVFAPPGTPASIIGRVNREIVKVLNQPDVKTKFLNAGLEVDGGTPEALTAWIRSEMARWGKVIQDAGIKVE